MDVRIRVPDPLYYAWRGEARALGLTIGQYVQLRMGGVLPAPMATVDPVVNIIAALAEAPPLRDRVLAEIGADGLRKRAVPALAKRLGVTAKSLHASLGSMVASKRLTRVGDLYSKVGV